MPASTGSLGCSRPGVIHASWLEDSSSSRSEDVGLADPVALVVADAAARAVEFVGLPEAQLNLAEAVIYLAAAPKSNTVTTALGRALRRRAKGSCAEVPGHLRDAHYPGAKSLGSRGGLRVPP